MADDTATNETAQESTVPMGESAPASVDASADRPATQTDNTPTAEVNQATESVAASASPDTSRGEPASKSESRSRSRFSRSGSPRSEAGSTNSAGNQRSEGNAPRRVLPSNLQPIHGILDTTPDGHAVIRRGWGVSSQDAYLSLAVVRKLGLRPGDEIDGLAREPRENDRYWGMSDVTKANGIEIKELGRRPRFEDLVPVYPDEKLTLETGPEPLSTRLIDLFAPIGKGQRGLIVSPPKAGKTSIMKEIATGIATNYPEVHLMAVLIGERPEEVTDIRRHLEKITNGKGEVPASNFDEHASEQTRVAEVALERAKRLVETGRDVVILLDSITRLARAYNLAMPTSGRTLSGGFDPAALYPPKRFFGAARNFENGGSLTIIGTALIDTGSRMDDLVYEEFKGTGNQELHLDRRLAERRIFPAINVQRSGTRRDDLLFSPNDYQSILTMQRMLDMLNEEERTSVVLARLKETKTNKQFLASLKDG